MWWVLNDYNGWMVDMVIMGRKGVDNTVSKRKGL